MIKPEHAALLTPLQNRLIVSCQAKVGEPLRDPDMLAAIAQLVVDAGACAVRANEPGTIRAMRARINVPILGIYKRFYDDSPVYITPTLADAEAIVSAGCDILTVEATNQPRPNGESLETFMREVRDRFDLPIMADISTVEEGIRAAELGADIIATTLAGYTPYSRQMDEPDLELVEKLARDLEIPVIAEGRIATPTQVKAAFDKGAFSVVVGSMITRPGHITAYFIKHMTD
jgi:N-acylglucosamine-6-phosphate 2-epimerase